MSADDDHVTLWNGVPYRYWSEVPPGARLVLPAGACPLDAEGRVEGAGDVRAQASACVRNLAEALADAGAGVADVVLLRVLVASADREELAAAWSAVLDHLDGHEPPGTLMGVAALGWPDQLVEVEAVAAVVSRAEPAP